MLFKPYFNSISTFILQIGDILLKLWSQLLQLYVVMQGISPNKYSARCATLQFVIKDKILRVHVFLSKKDILHRILASVQ